MGVGKFGEDLGEAAEGAGEEEGGVGVFCGDRLGDL